MRSSAAEDGRSVAVDQLVRIEDQGAFAGRMALPTSLDPRDRRFVTEVVSGVTRWRRWLDFVIQKSAGRSLELMEPALRQILRIGAYEILEMQTPEYAAVNEAVNLAKRLVRPGAGGLVNAVLRKVIDARQALPEPGGSVASRLGIRYSHPDWIVRRWLDRFGEAETQQLLQWNNQRPTYSVRANHLKISNRDLQRLLQEAGIDGSASPYLDDFIRVDSMQQLLDTDIVSDGLAVVQDDAAGLVIHALDPQPGEDIADCCAAPGGKLLYAADRMNNTGSLSAIESNDARLSLTRRSAATLGVENVEFVLGDATKLAGLLPGKVFDRVLVDAPCTGLGVLAKRPDLRWHRRPSDIPELTVLQDRLLDAAANAVRPGGLIVYATCTIESAENEDRVTDFLSRNPHFEIENVAPFVPEDFVTDAGYCASLPHRDGIDGAFAARLRRAF